MKISVLVSIACLALQSQGALASKGPLPQQPTMNMAVLQRASSMTHALINQLHLNEAEYVHLRTVHCVLIDAVDSIDTRFANDPTQRHAKLQELQGYYEQERLRVLTPSQVSRLEEHSVRETLPAINTESGGLG